MSVKRWNKQVNTREDMNKYLRVYSGVNAEQYLKNINSIDEGNMICHPQVLEYHKCVYRAYCYFHNKNNKKFNKYFNKCDSISRDLMDNLGEKCENNIDIRGLIIGVDRNLTRTTNEESYKDMCDMICSNYSILDKLKKESLISNYFK